MGNIANCQQKNIKNFFIIWFIKKYQVDLTEAEFPDPKVYKNFNHFFTRRLKSNARPIPTQENVIISPVDGKIYQFGKINNGSIIQAKGRDFSLLELVGGQPELAQPFLQGDFITLYLAPKDYHRVHMPITGILREMIYIPGKLFSVNPVTTENIPNLFARNERVVCMFDTAIGQIVVILVGALIVGSIHTAWAKQIFSIKKKTIQYWRYDNQAEPIKLQGGDELGHFQLGSTVIVLLPPVKISWNDKVIAGKAIKMGEIMGDVKL
jgi:phosphatidylserine decarboxylase